MPHTKVVRTRSKRAYIRQHPRYSRLRTKTPVTRKFLRNTRQKRRTLCFVQKEHVFVGTRGFFNSARRLLPYTSIRQIRVQKDGLTLKRNPTNHEAKSEKKLPKSEKRLPTQDQLIRKETYRSRTHVLRDSAPPSILVVCCYLWQCDATVRLYTPVASAVCCSVLQCVAVCCSVLQCVAVCCSVLRCVTTVRLCTLTSSAAMRF